MPVLGGWQIPTSQVWDVTQIYETDVTKPEFKELLVRMYQQLNTMAMAVNGRDAGVYTTDEFVNGQTFFPTPGLTSASATKPTQRQVYRKVINFGALPNVGTKTVTHGLDMKSTWTVTRLYGAATDPATPKWIPLPYSTNTAGANIELFVDGTNVTVTTAADYSAYTVTYIVSEYLKQ